MRSGALSCPNGGVSLISDLLVVSNSENKKLGNMAATYRTEATCPTTCPLFQNGCYGLFRGFVHADRHGRTMTEDEIVAKLEQAPRASGYVRDRVVGDLVASDGTFDRKYVQTIARAAKRAGLVAYGYTHHWAAMTRQDVAAVRKSNYRLSASCETEGDVEAALAKGLQVVLTGDTWTDGERVAGRRVITCPNQQRSETKCADCGLCMKDRDVIIRFNLHGNGKRKAGAAIQQRIEEAA